MNSVVFMRQVHVILDHPSYFKDRFVLTLQCLKYSHFIESIMLRKRCKLNFWCSEQFCIIFYHIKLYLLLFDIEIEQYGTDSLIF